MKKGALLFRIVADHQHEAGAGGRVFRCEREVSFSSGRRSIRWSAFEGKTLLNAECRTLNDAKKLCRAAASAATAAAPY